MMMFGRRWLPAVVLLAVSLPHSQTFSLHSAKRARYQALVALYAAKKEDLDIKAELTEYLEKRKMLNADEEAKAEVGKVIGGTKGNKVLEYVSGAPNKAIVIEEEPNIFDYDQLTKYGYGHLVTPIMNMGGRSEMYKLMDMEPPALRVRKPKEVPKLVIDRKGETDRARYSGLKMGQVLDDETMGRALEEANRKKQRGESLRPKLEEESYVMPFADKRNTSPRQTPDWTPERLDEEGRKRGKAIAWARKARAGEFVNDPYESLSLDGALRAYSIFASILVAFAFGRATPIFINMMGADDLGSGIQDLLQVPALAVVLASIGSTVVNSVVMAPEKNRSRFVWGVKGMVGGPVAVSQLRSLDALQTRGEMDKAEADGK